MGNVYDDKAHGLMRLSCRIMQIKPHLKKHQP